MPQNKRESLIFSLMMCFFMVLWMSIYNVSLHLGELSLLGLKEAWLGFPIAFTVALCCDLFFVSRFAKGFAFHYLIKPESSNTKKAIIISCCMVIPMVFIMSFYGAIEVCIRSREWNRLALYWFMNLPKNFIMALPLQLIIAGPMIRRSFRALFPVGKILD
ncbi:MAG: DUF2798 domain-containing protein [Mobilitalea sp.]